MSARSMPAAIPASLPPLSRLLVTVGLTLAAWETRLRGRHALARLDDHLLRDIGMTHDCRADELRRPFWQD